MKLQVISRHPLESRHPTPLLFIHGMMYGAWCWDVHFLDYFAERGFAAHAVNLRGRRDCALRCLPGDELVVVALRGNFSGISSAALATRPRLPTELHP